MSDLVHLECVKTSKSVTAELLSYTDTRTVTYRPVVSLSNILNLLDRFKLFVADLTRVGNASAFCILYVEYG